MTNGSCLFLLLQLGRRGDRALSGLLGSRVDDAFPVSLVV
jgi:hypothetical protein